MKRYSPDEIADLLGCEVQMFVEEYQGRTRDEVERDLDEMFPGEENTELAQSIRYWSVLLHEE